MNNKRGIAQAFPNPPQGIALRRASVFDVFGMSRVLIRSITRLCAADHKNDPRVLSLWTAGKDPATLRDRIEGGSASWLAGTAGQVAAVGEVLETGKISLLFVDPDYTGRGIGSALLERLEREIAALGHAEAHLDATRTAREFYLAQGWQRVGAPGEWHGIPQFPMRKSLHSPAQGLRPHDPGDKTR